MHRANRVRAMFDARELKSYKVSNPEWDCSIDDRMIDWSRWRQRIDGRGFDYLRCIYVLM
jgi:hypothetical protein